MEAILLFLITFIIIFIIYLLFVVFNKKGLKKIYNGTEAKYLKKLYKLDLNKLDKKKFAIHIALINSFIISITLSIVVLVENYLLMILLAFIIVILLILSLYHLLAINYKNKLGVKKDV